MKNWKIYAFWIGLAEVTGALAALLTKDAMGVYMNTFVQPSFAPPGWLFPVVWTVLYGLMGIGAARISLAEAGRRRNRALNVWIAQLIVNFFWSLFFFNAQKFGFAFLWILLLLLLILWMIFAFWKVDKVSALLQIPYVLWASFAAILNYGVWKLN